MADSNTILSVIIITHNSAKWLEQCLLALRESLRDIESELIVIDNASEDDSLEIIRAISPQSIITTNSENNGFASAANSAAELASGEWLLFINPDLVVNPQTIKTLLQVASGHDKVGLVTGRLQNPDGTLQPNCRNFPSVSNLLFSRGSLFASWLGGSDRYTLKDFTQTTVVPAVAGTLLLIKRTLWIDQNGFDTRYFMFMEDTDLSKRVNIAGFDNLYVPEASAIHHWGESSDASRWRRSYYHHQSLGAYFRKHRPGLFSLLVLPLLLWIHLLLTGLFRARGGR